MYVIKYIYVYTFYTIRNPFLLAYIFIKYFKSKASLLKLSRKVNELRVFATPFQPPVILDIISNNILCKECIKSTCYRPGQHLNHLMYEYLYTPYSSFFSENFLEKCGFPVYLFHILIDVISLHLTF